MAKSTQFGEIQYTQCARPLRGTWEEMYPHTLDPGVPPLAPRYSAPIYDARGTAYCCVPVDAAVGERLVTPGPGGICDSGTIMEVYEIVAIDAEIGEEVAPWHPLQPCRRAIVERIYTGTPHARRADHARHITAIRAELARLGLADVTASDAGMHAVDMRGLVRIGDGDEAFTADCDTVLYVVRGLTGPTDGDTSEGMREYVMGMLRGSIRA